MAYHQYHQSKRQLVQNWWQQHQQHHHRYAISDNDDDDFIRHKAFSPSSPPPPPPSSSSQPPFSSHWPQLASRQRASLRSPTLPDEELNSMLQSYLDEKFPQQNNKMDYDTGGSYGPGSSYNYNNNAAFLPNVSPSASSLDSGYCGPASVQSSIDSPHNNLVYPSSPWTPQQNYYPTMHSEYHQNYHQQQQQQALTESPKNYQDQDISQIVDQVLSCIDQYNDETQTSTNEVRSMETPAQASAAAPEASSHNAYRDGLETLLCHNCGALMNKNKTEIPCRGCGAELKDNSEKSSRKRKHKTKPCSQDDYWTESKKCKQRSVGVVEPRVVVRIPKKHLEAKDKTKVHNKNDQSKLQLAAVGNRKTCSDSKIAFINGVKRDSSLSESSCSESSDCEEPEVRPAKKNTNFRLKTPDDQWIYCEVRGCSFWTRKPERMVRHRQCHRPDTKYYKCPDCSLRFYSLAKMLKHDRKVHTGVKDYECRVCEAEVTDIQIHMRVHKAEKQFECPVCPMEFRHKNSLVRHLCQHTGERPYRCQSCDSAFISMHRLKEHQKKSHHVEAEQEVQIISKTPEKKKVIKEEPKIDVVTAAHQPAILSIQPILTASPILSLVQGSNGQVYLIQQSSSATTTSPSGNLTVAGGNELFSPVILSSQQQTDTVLLTTTQNATKVNKVNWMMPRSSATSAEPKLDIDLSKSQQAQQPDIVTSALVASRVLKGVI